MKCDAIDTDIAGIDFTALARTGIKFEQDRCRAVFKIIKNCAIGNDGVGMGMKLADVPASHCFARFNRCAQHVMDQARRIILIILGIQWLNGKTIKRLRDELFLKRSAFQGFFGKLAPACIIRRRKF